MELSGTNCTDYKNWTAQHTCLFHLESPGFRPLYGRFLYIFVLQKSFQKWTTTQHLNAARLSTESTCNSWCNSRNSKKLLLLWGGDYETMTTMTKCFGVTWSLSGCLLAHRSFSPTSGGFSPKIGLFWAQMSPFHADLPGCKKFFYILACKTISQAVATSARVSWDNIMSFISYEIYLLIRGIHTWEDQLPASALIQTTDTGEG